MTDVSSALIEHLRQRAAFGKNKYGIELQAFDGRNTLMDALEEVLDLAVYIKKEIMEREGSAALHEKSANLIEFITGDPAAEVVTELRDMAQKLRQDIKRIEPEDTVLSEDVRLRLRQRILDELSTKE